MQVCIMICVYGCFCLNGCVCRCAGTRPLVRMAVGVQTGMLLRSRMFVYM